MYYIFVCFAYVMNEFMLCKNLWCYVIVEYKLLVADTCIQEKCLGYKT